MTNRPLATSTLIILLSLLALSACIGGSSATDWAFGEALTVRVKEMRLVDEVAYSIEDNHYVIRPSQEGKMIAAARLEMRNRQANVVFLSIDAESARLRDAEFFDYRPLNPFQDRTEVDRAPSSDGSSLPVPYVLVGDESSPDPKARLLWGDGSPNAPAVELHKKCGDLDCELVGWMLFEVPSDIEYYQFIWETADTIFMRF